MRGLATLRASLHERRVKNLLAPESLLSILIVLAPY